MFPRRLAFSRPPTFPLPTPHARAVGLFALTVCAWLSAGNAFGSIEVVLRDGTTLTVDRLSARPGSNRVDCTLVRAGIQLTRHVPRGLILGMRRDGELVPIDGPSREVGHETHPARLAEVVLRPARFIPPSPRQSLAPLPHSSSRPIIVSTSGGPEWGIQGRPPAPLPAQPSMSPPSSGYFESRTIGPTVGPTGQQPVGQHMIGDVLACPVVMGPEAIGFVAPPRVFPPGWAPTWATGDPLLSRGVEVGWRDEPLSAYPDLEAQQFPAGIPLSERRYALDLFRTQTARRALGWGPGFVPMPGSFLGPGFVPGYPSGPATVPLGPSPVPPSSSSGRVEGVSAWAQPTTSGGGLDWTALNVRLDAQTGSGQPASLPAGSTVRLRLRGQRQQLAPGFGSVVTQLGPVETMATWDVAVGDIGATLTSVSGSPAAASTAGWTLPLPSSPPDHDVSWSPQGELTAEVTAPGQGVYFAPPVMVPLRQGNSFRETQLLETGSQFDAAEASASRQFSRRPWERGSTSGPNSRIFAVEP